MSTVSFTKTDSAIIGSMTNLRILETALLTNCERLSILILRMEIYKKVYWNSAEGHQICKIALYFVGLEPFFSERTRLSDSVPKRIVFLHERK